MVTNAETVDEGNLDTSESEKDNNSTDARNTDFSATPLTVPIGLSQTARRVCEPLWFIQQVLAIGRHGLVGSQCSMDKCVIQREKINGFASTLIFRCSACGRSDLELSLCELCPNNTKMDINYSAVLGNVSIGCGYTQLKDFCSILDLPSMGVRLYNSVHEKVGRDLETTAAEQMRSAVEEEKAEAVRVGNVDVDKVPLLTVTGDGCWSHRSYGTNYKSLNGAATLIGAHTNKVLWYGVKSKHCTVCSKHERNGEEIGDHICTKNHNGSSTSMETALLVEAFNKSEEQYGVRYSTLIADGDSSVYNQILNSRPYKTIKVRKLECNNHLFRNLYKRLIALSKNSKFPLIHRKIFSKSIDRFCKGIRSAMKHWKESQLPTNEKTKNLKTDIINAPYHIFGDHKKCQSYFCNGKESENLVEDMRTSGFFQEVFKILRYFSTHSNSLVEFVSSNAAEQFNGIVAKFTGGKRINFSLKKSYAYRVAAAVIQHNSKRLCYSVHKTAFLSSPSCVMKKIELKRSLKKVRKRLFKPKSVKKPEESAHYGLNCAQPDMTTEEYEETSKDVIDELIKNQKNRVQIERETHDQSNSMRWSLLRQNMITASSFGRICRAKTGYTAIVKDILYPNALNCEAVRYGREHEQIALEKLAVEAAVKIQRCGLFIDENIYFLGATPDGLIDADGCVEVKCSYKGSAISPHDAILAGHIDYIQVDKKSKDIIGLKKVHRYYYQVQGQLAVTGRKYCLFAVFTNENENLYIEKIRRDDQFIAAMMPKLHTFFNVCLLPEIVDPRRSRSLPLRTYSKECLM